MDVRQSHSLRVSLEQELSASIDPAVEEHWNKKIRAGIVPTEVLNRSEVLSQVDFSRHYQEMERLAEFELYAFIEVLDYLAAEKKSLRSKQVHYFGIGMGLAFKKVAAAANNAGLDVVAYDISSIGCNNGRRMLAELDEEKGDIAQENNTVYQADIEFACQKKYINRRACLIVAPRVLDVLDNVAKDPKKMKRTATRIGKLLRFLKVLLIHPEPKGNEDALFRDTTLVSLDQLARYMASSLKAEVAVERLGTCSFHGHVYTAGLLQKRQ